MIDTLDFPMGATDLAQDGPSTYAHYSLSLTWKAPADTGCQALTGYKFQIFDAPTSSWIDVATQTMYGTTPKGTAGGLTSGILTKLRIVARNAQGYGVPSAPITLTPASRPGSPGAVIVT